MQTQIPGQREVPIDQVAAQRAYDDELVRRFEQGLPLTAADKKAARRLIRLLAA